MPSPSKASWTRQNAGSSSRKICMVRLLVIILWASPKKGRENHRWNLLVKQNPPSSKMTMVLKQVVCKQANHSISLRSTSPRGKRSFLSRRSISRYHLVGRAPRGPSSRSERNPIMPRRLAWASRCISKIASKLRRPRLGGKTLDSWHQQGQRRRHQRRRRRKIWHKRMKKSLSQS